MIVCLASPSDISLEIGCANHADSAGNIIPPRSISRKQHHYVSQENISYTRVAVMAIL